MAGEEWARRVVEKELRRPVHLNDDGSAPGMYDLRIGASDAPEIAIECVGAVDPVFTEAWNIGPAKGPLFLALAGDWIVEIMPMARVNDVKQHLQPLLKEMEAREMLDTGNGPIDQRDHALFDRLDSLKIVGAHCYRTPGAGKVHLSLSGSGGAVDEKGSKVAEWLGDFLRHPSRADVLSKLLRAQSKECHAFVIVSLLGVPWAVESYLTGALDHAPSDCPRLPCPVSRAWVVPSYGDSGLYWDGVAWRAIATQREKK